MLAAGLLGVYLSVRLLAALHAVRDLWYARGRSGPRLARGLLGWGGVAAALAWWLRPPWREALLWGLGGYAVFYLCLFPLRDLGLRALARRSRP